MEGRTMSSTEIKRYSVSFKRLRLIKSRVVVLVIVVAVDGNFIEQLPMMTKNNDFNGCDNFDFINFFDCGYIAILKYNHN
jgi:hypothetical protein